MTASTSLSGNPRPEPAISHDVAQLKDWDRNVVWHAFTQMQEYDPFIVQSAQGCTLIDVDGREYIDGVSSLWCNVHGHRHPKLDQAIRDQLDRVAHFTNLGGSNDTTIRLAKKLVDVAPEGLNHVFFSDSGATAVEAGLKMAFQYWRQCDHPQPTKTRYITLQESYHGDTIGSVSIGGMAMFHDLFKPLLFEPIRCPVPDTYRLPSGVAPLEACDFYLQQLEALLAQHADEVAAVVIEPLVQGAAGMVMHPTGFLAGVRELTQRYDVLMIADEVAVGMGRTGKLFACEHEHVVPDIVCLGKGLSGGYLPVAATIATTEVWSAFLGEHHEAKTFFHGHTFGGNPLGAAVSLASLELFEEEQTLQEMQPKIERLATHLSQIAKLPGVGDTRQRGLMAGIEIVKDQETREPFPWSDRKGHQVCQHAIANGVWLRPLGNVVVIMPPLCVSLDQLDTICGAACEGIRALDRADG
jgi:adenosylmethionine-8-amino-7-oxononanoate aminotransferase